MVFSKRLIQEFNQEISSGSDRTIAIIFSANLEDILTELIKTKLKNDKDSIDRLLKPGRPLSGLVNKAVLAYLLNLISKHSKKDIERVAEIRNLFAHRAKHIDFSDKDIIKSCKQITTLDRLAKFSTQSLNMPGPQPYSSGDAKLNFMYSITALITHFEQIISHPESARFL